MSKGYGAIGPRKLRIFLAMAGIGLSSAAQAATCPPQYQESWVAPQFANATAVLNASLKSVDASLSTQLTFQSERLNSAIAVLTQQKALSASQLADVNRTTAQQVATGLGALSQTERVKAARFDYGGEFGQGFSPCEVYATRSVIASRDADMVAELGSRVQTEVIAAPGRYASRVEAAAQLFKDNQASCTEDMVKVGLCRSVGATPGASMSVATLFDVADEGDDVYKAKNAFINNIVGLPDPPLNTLKGPAQEAYMLAKARKDAVLSPAVASLKALQLEYSGVEGGETGAGVPLAQMFRDEVARYAGGTQANEAWSRVMAAQNERGAMVEILKIKALDLAIQTRQLRQYERMEANLAALVAAEAQSNSAVGAARVQADTDQAAKDMARRGIQ
ncbi:hypothetical protein [Achromobacter insolitus]|uniref:hypothetical protein n=1 Tax=Achromobacter insolitus TaxID=217204 RepID=UPI0007C2A76F|nr:hypothetical protein [Achromobacter insolitus]OAD16519.1 hypothetical protein A3839_28540 [Achromobacter insolitus]